MAAANNGTYAEKNAYGVAWRKEKAKNISSISSISRMQQISAAIIKYGGEKKIAA